MAEKLGGKYHILQISDGLSPEFFLQAEKRIAADQSDRRIVFKSGYIGYWYRQCRGY